MLNFIYNIEYTFWVERLHDMLSVQLKVFLYTFDRDRASCAG